MNRIVIGMSDMKAKLVILMVIVLVINCNGQMKMKIDESKVVNALLCDSVAGVCVLPGSGTTTPERVVVSNEKPVKVIYFTDPICSSCWGIEPQLRKMKLEYGNYVEIEYRMGGLLPDWSYNSGGISKPADVASHWDEASRHYDMPIDGDVWLKDPLHSSYPPSIAFKAAQLQDQEKAVLFLRVLREMVFLEKKNITRWANIEQAAITVGLNTEQLFTDFQGKAKVLFEEDRTLAAEMSVRGFPTMFFVGSTGKSEIVYGSKPYAYYAAGVIMHVPNAERTVYSKELNSLFEKFSSLTAREFSELSGTPRNASEVLLNEQVSKGLLEKVTTRNGSIWRRKESIR